MANTMKKGTARKVDTKRLVTLAMLCAMSYVVMWISKMLLPPLIPAVEFLKYDAKDVVIMLCGFMFGPIAAIGISVVVSLIEMVTVSGTGIIGFIMNVISTCAFVCPAAIIYNRKQKKISTAVIGLAVGCVTVTVAMMLWNYVVTPYYMKVDRDLVVKLLLPGFLPFNLIKSVINAALAMLIYKPTVMTLRKAKLLPESKSDNSGNWKRSIVVVIGSCVVLATCVLVVLAIYNII